jgi:hypothetical protein
MSNLSKNPGNLGRPSLYTPEIAEEICTRLAAGEGLNAICKDEHMPHEATVRRWDLEDREGFSTKYAQAREIDLERAADEMRRIADEMPKDQVEATWQKTRLDQRKWELSKRLPRKFGERLGLEHSGSLDLGLAEAMRKARERLDKARDGD